MSPAVDRWIEHDLLDLGKVLHCFRSCCCCCQVGESCGCLASPPIWKNYWGAGLLCSTASSNWCAGERRALNQLVQRSLGQRRNRTLPTHKPLVRACVTLQKGMFLLFFFSRTFFIIGHSQCPSRAPAASTTTKFHTSSQVQVDEIKAQLETVELQERLSLMDRLVPLEEELEQCRLQQQELEYTWQTSNTTQLQKEEHLAMKSLKAWKGLRDAYQSRVVQQTRRCSIPPPPLHSAHLGPNATVLVHLTSESPVEAHRSDQVGASTSTCKSGSACCIL